ncbi:hypothetical protein IEN85_10170 [Pelagicoccus sp. NFK12]|uniref:Uncharacterized protein n=1 Tax=Pelagicoccus enzymogenes TaxID=2773457 RepID=A0A927F8L3_9BACT|nr:hypothetical protein [Pelagicoccus enzymogenes]MBD5779854.1 hypothetical protein [Pelagicoccus enzymogenes]
MKNDFPVEHVAKGMPVTMEAFIALLVFALPIAFLGFGIYWLMGRKKRREEREFEEYMKERNETPALREN